MLDDKNPKVALVHEYLIQYGGAEKTLEALINLFPKANIYTGMYTPNKMSKIINSHNVTAPKNSLLSRFPKYLTFLMPFVFENFDLSEYDVVISDGTAWPKGVQTKPDQLHISYIHTPPRFLYGYSVESQKRNKWYFKPIVVFVDYFLRIWDYNAAQRPNYLLTNSKETRGRIKKFYGRDAKVIYPPVEVVRASKYKKNKSKISKNVLAAVKDTNYYLMLGRLSAYKNFDLVIEAFNNIDTPLLIAGTGLEERRLRKMAKKHIIFLGQVTEEEKHYLLENCLGLINPVEDEDLGIVPIEAMAHGKPVLAHKSGGHLETIQKGVSGMFFEEFSQGEFLKKFREFDKKISSGDFNSNKIKKGVLRFDEKRFKKEFGEFVEKKLKEHLNA